MPDRRRRRPHPVQILVPPIQSRSVENAYTVVDLKISPGLSTVEGNSA
jgi:hypothetical protein